MSSLFEFIKIAIFAMIALYLQIFVNFFFLSPFLTIFPSLILIFIIGSRGSSFKALWLGALIGLSLDSFNFSFSGYDTFLYAFFGALSGLMSGDKTKIKVEGIQRLPIFLFLFNLFLFLKSLFITPKGISLLSWVISSLTYYIINMAPANVVTIILFIVCFTIFKNEK